jgi:hypothetical protein
MYAQHANNRAKREAIDVLDNIAAGKRWPALDTSIARDAAARKTAFNSVHRMLPLRAQSRRSRMRCHSVRYYGIEPRNETPRPGAIIARAVLAPTS